MAQKTTLSTIGIPGALPTFTAKTSALVTPDSYPFGAYARCLIGDPLGQVKAEVQPAMGPVLWRLNDLGQVKLRFTVRDPLFYKELFRFGGRVLLQFSNGLPDWGGVFDPPERWSADGTIETVAYEAGYLLGFRRTAKRRRFIEVTVGTILASLIDEANAISEVGLTLGSVWYGGDQHRVEYNYTSLLDVLRKSLTQDLSNADWDVRPVYSNGTITFRVGLYEQKGTTKNGVCLIEGHNAEVEYQRVGSITNQWYVAGGGSDWGENRKVGTAYDASSISSYGLREGLKTVSGNLYQYMLDNQAALLVADSKSPHAQLGAVSVDRAPGKFQDYDVGDTIKIMSHSFGYDGLALVVAREFDPSTCMCKNVIEEVV